MEKGPPVQSKSEETKLQLVKAATTAFAYEGFHATSLKKIARTAGVNQALIAYHFGNKEGLYLAVFESIAGQIQAKVGPRVETLQAALGAQASSRPASAGSDPEASRQALFSIVDAMLELLSSDASREWALLITREQSSPTEAFEILYRGFMGKMLGLATQVIQMLKPGITVNEARLFAVLMMGQVLVFRVSKTAVLRHMGWQGYGKDEIASAKRQLHQNINAWLSK
jgi:TetR/AcrR family transcriptional regulator, regulator of cefoperazone and chloramphenicol sensitivity